MPTYVDILTMLKSAASQASLVEEKWGHLKLSGIYYPNLLLKFKEIRDKFKEIGLNNTPKLSINGNPISQDDFELYENSNSIQSWVIDLNKLPLINIKDVEGWHYNLFLKTESCCDWLKGSNPLLKKHPFNEFSRLRIIADDLTNPFGGEMIQFLGPDHLNLPKPLSHSEGTVPLNLPLAQALKENTHFITNEEIEVNLATYQVYGAANSKLKKEFLYKACQILSLYLINEYYSKDKVVINGIKRVVLSLDDGTATISEEFYNQLFSLVSWIYEDQIVIRRKLFIERLSLDRDESHSLLTALTKNIKSAAEQAKERYNFVIIDRKDAYVKELKELLKDIRTQSELYSLKIRNLLSNFLRDLLAAILLIGFTIFTKFTENSKLINQELLEYVFYGLALYYLFSILMQSMVDIADINISKKEVIYWKNATKEYLPEREFKDHIDKSLKSRRISLRIIYPILSACYLIIAVACYKYPVIFKKLMISSSTENTQQKPSTSVPALKKPIHHNPVKPKSDDTKTQAGY